MIQLHFIGGWASTPLVWQEVMANLTPHLKDTPHHITYWDWDVLLDLTSSASCNFQENDRLIPGANHIWIAWSSGTLALFRLAACLSENPKNHLFVGISPMVKFVNDAGWKLGWRRATVKTMINRLQVDTCGTLKDFYQLAQKGGRSPGIDLQPVLDQVQEEGLQLPLAHLQDGLTLLVESDKRHQIKKISHPLVIISGDQDRICPPGQARWIEGEARQVQWVTHTHGSHLIPLSHGADVARAILDLMA